ncbi:MAG: adenylate/guanylate cyclase domain-containing protein [Desulfonatronovibrionaceae bacterium]
MRLSHKIFLMIFAVAFTISGATGSYFYIQASRSILSAVRDQLKTSSTALAGSISGDLLNTITRPEHDQTSAYLEIQAILANIVLTNDEFLYAYTMRLEDGKVLFVVDSPPSDDDGDGKISEDEMPSPVGTVYENPPESLLKGFTRPSSDPEPYRDDWGWTISGYAPIFDQKGRLAGLLGIDMSLERFQQKLTTIKMAGMISLFMALLLASGLTWLLTRSITRPFKELEQGFDRIINGNLETKLNAQGRDEAAVVKKHFNQMLDELKEKEKLKATLGKIMPRGLLPAALTRDLTLGGEMAWTTVLFCDLRNFTSMSEKIPPKVLVGMLNEYFTAMVAVVEKNSGMVDKFIGDKLMAVFGHPAPTGNDQQNALNAALEMLVKCDELNRDMATGKDLKLENSIGIHSGPVLSGSIGSPERMELTIMGDTVNIAARLETSTRHMNTRLAISQETGQAIQGLPLYLQYAGLQSIEGRKDKLGVYILSNDFFTNRLSQNQDRQT